MVLIVGKNNVLNKEYTPEITEFEGISISKEIYRPLCYMAADSRRQGIQYKVVSGYRSYERQHMLYINSMMKNGVEHAIKYVAPPGASEHQTGLALDISCEEINFGLEEEFDKTNEYRWLKDNCHKYGFIMRYPKGNENITGIAYEPWHYRYVGRKIAFAMKMSNVDTLEEWLALTK